MISRRAGAQVCYATLLIVIGCLGSGCATAQLKTQSIDPNSAVEIDSVLAAIQEGLQQAQSRLALDDLPPLSQVKLVLNTTTHRIDDGSFSILILSFGQKFEESKTQQLTLILKPPKGQTGPESALTDELAFAIVQAARGVKGVGDREPKLELTEMTVQLKFVVVAQSDFTVGPLKIVPVSAELKSDLKATATHDIMVTFKVPATGTK